MYIDHENIIISEIENVVMKLKRYIYIYIKRILVLLVF